MRGASARRINDEDVGASGAQWLIARGFEPELGDESLHVLTVVVRANGFSLSVLGRAPADLCNTFMVQKRAR